MSLVFADTFYWIALINRRDKAHVAVMEVTRLLAPGTVGTTDEVLTEFLAYCSGDSMLRGIAGSAVSRLIVDPDIRVIPQSRRLSLRD